MVGTGLSLKPFNLQLELYVALSNDRWDSLQWPSEHLRHTGKMTFILAGFVGVSAKVSEHRRSVSS